MKRLLSLLLALVLTITLMPLQVQAKTGGKLIAITFDDGPSSELTPQLLDGLKERGVPVTFFVMGNRSQRNAALIRRAYEEGHEIGSHTWDHPNLKELSSAKIKDQLKKSFAELDKILGKGSDYTMRPPYGAVNDKVKKAIDVPMIYWTVDSLDWKLKNVEKVRDKIVAETFDGCIILCHDVHETTIPAALAAIDKLMQEGYEFVTVSELFRRRGRTLKTHDINFSSLPNDTDLGPIAAPTITMTPKGDKALITLTNPDPNVPLYYTTDGTFPDQTAKRYTGPFTVPYFTEVKAVAAYKLNGSRSVVEALKPQHYPVAAPTIALADGKVTITTPNPNVTIRYTLDGTQPTAEAAAWTGSQTVDGGTTIRAVAIHSLAGRSDEVRAYFSEFGSLYYDMAPGAWYYDSMDWAHREGILNGMSPYTMGPDVALNRAMLTTLLYRFSSGKLEPDWTRTHSFGDIPEDSYFAEAVEWAYRNGIVSGYSETVFAPEDIVTRQQMCKMLAAYLTYRGTPLERGPSCADQFRDYAEVEPWAEDSVNDMVHAGLIQGSVGLLTPNAGASRAQFCTLLLRVRDFILGYSYPEALVWIPESRLPV